MPNPIEFALRLSGADETARGLQTVMGGFGMVTQGVSTAVQAFRAFAQEADRQSSIMGSLATDIGPARQAIQGMVSDLDLAQASNRLTAAGLNLTGQQLRNVVVAAFQQADRTGGDFNRTLDQLGRAIVSGGRGLQQFGVHAHTQREALQQLAEQFGDVTVEADTLADHLDQLSTTADNVETSFLTALESTHALEDGFTSFFNAVNGGSEDFGHASEEIVHFAEFMGYAVGNVVHAMADQFTHAAEAFRALTRGDFATAAHQFQQSLAVSPLAQIANGNVFDRAGQLQAANDFLNEGRDGSGTITAPAPRGRGHRAEDPFSAAALARSNAHEEAFAAQISQGQEEDHRRALEERQRQEDEYLDHIKEGYRELWDEEKEADRDREERARNEHDMRMELLNKEKTAARAASDELHDQALSVLQPVVNGLVDAVSHIIAGSKSADEAFKGLLSSFLEMISQQAALQAAKEFADAIASFAREDYSGGALHLAAGVAFTGVAIAAGAAGIAVAPPAAASPASPQQPSASDNGGGNTIVVNYNGPVITAGDRAEVGRTLDQLVGEGRRYYGAAA